jgi:cytochrome c oxidase cbb3-type subunit 3
MSARGLRTSGRRKRGSRGEAAGRAAIGCAALACLVVLAGCERENRNLAGGAETGPSSVAVSELRPGPPSPPPPEDPRAQAYEGNATHIANGQRDFQQFNCAGCHFNGGGGIGPALMDDKWRYGSRIDQVYASIAQGRPNGMPSFKGVIPDEQIWELAAYVVALSGNGDKLAEPSRTEDMRTIPPLNNLDRQPPKSDPAATKVGP